MLPPAVIVGDALGCRGRSFLLLAAATCCRAALSECGGGCGCDGPPRCDVGEGDARAFVVDFFVAALGVRDLIPGKKFTSVTVPITTVAVRRINQGGGAGGG